MGRITAYKAIPMYAVNTITTDHMILRVAVRSRLRAMSQNVTTHNAIRGSDRATSMKVSSA